MFRSLRSILAAAALVAQVTAHPAVQSQILVSKAQPLGGSRVREVLGFDLHAGSHWSANVALEDGSTAALLDGAIVARSGTALPNGDVPLSLRAAFDDVGNVLLLYELPPTTAGTIVPPPNTRLLFNGQEVLRTGDSLLGVPGPVPGAGFSAAEPIASIGGIVLGDGAALVKVSAGPDGLIGDIDAWLHFDVDQGSGFTNPRLPLIQYQTSPAISREVEDLLRRAAVAGPDAFAIPFVYSSAGGFRACDFGGVGVLQHGEPAPLPGHTWRWPDQGDPRLDVAAGPGGAILIASGDTVGPAAPPHSGTGIIARFDAAGSAALLEAEGAPLSVDPARTVGNFREVDVAIAPDGRAAYCVPTLGGGPLDPGPRVLVHDGQVALVEGETFVGGRRLARLFTGPPILFGDPPVLYTVRMAPDDGSCAVLCELGSGGLHAVVRVDARVGTPESCAGAVNSTGEVGRAVCFGSESIAALAGGRRLAVRGEALPAGQAALLLAARTPGTQPGLLGGLGTLCLGGSVGRFVTQAAAVGAGGTVVTSVDPLALPQPASTVAAAPGETWYFQYLYRDAGAGGLATSNTTRAVTLTFAP